MVASSVPVGSGGAWHNANPSVGSGGAWHQVKNGWTGSGGVWHQFFQNLGPFTTSGGGGSSSGSSSAGAARDITDNWSIQSSALTIPATGGPTSGSYSYAWTITGDTGTSASFDNASLAQPTVSGSFTVGPASTDTDTVTCSCLVTDTVSGFSYTQTGITFSRTFTNNTG